MNRKPNSKIAVFVVGGFLILIGLPFALNGNINTFNPSPTATFNVNGVDTHPGDPAFSNAATIFLVIGVVIILLGSVVVILGLMGKVKGSFQTSNMYSQIPYTPFTNQNLSNPSNQHNDPQYSQGNNNPPSFGSTSLDSSAFNSSPSSQTSCSFCGAIIEPNKQFCSNCGKRLN